jgi:precorrin-6B C5,15-methyltransferase / cobalt-precorrin-6B C5,C15-methyltransferase
MTSHLSTPDSERAPWLSIVGIGAAGAEELAPAARSAIEHAEFVAGSARQLALVRACVRGEGFVWPSPLAEGVAKVVMRRGRSTCVLASGDPFFYGIGATLAPHLVRGEFVCHPAPSSMSLAAARLGWPLQDTDVVSLHGRDLHEIVRYLQPGRRVLALSWDRRTPRELAQLLAARRFGRSRLHVLEALGGPEERLRAGVASDPDLQWEDVADLNLVALELVADHDAFIVPIRASLPDGAFEHDGQLTKQDARAISLSALAPRAGELLWDVGAGAGSIGIEWLLSHPACRAIAIESDEERSKRIRRNANELGAPRLEIVHGTAPGALETLPAPHAIFIGGGASDAGVIDACWSALTSGGRLVINAVALETQAELTQRHLALGGELRRISIEHAVQLGTMHGFRPAMPIVQWRVAKP